MRTFKISVIFIWLIISVSCGSYKRIKTETDLTQKVVENQVKQTDKVVLETVETIIDYFDTVKDSLNKPQKKATVTQKKTTKTVDKVSEKTQSVIETDQNEKATEKQNPWQPPWYLSGLVTIIIFIAYKIFSSKYKIIKQS